MKVSVIIPVYNTGKYLRKCVKSICGQTHKDLQIILINDGSSDDSLEIMNELASEDDRICVIDKKHEGVSAARNAGLLKACGDYISFVDSDDWLDITTYQKCLELAEGYSADAIFFEWMEEFSDGSQLQKGYDGSKVYVLDENEIFTQYYDEKIRMRISSGLLSKRITKDVWFDISRERGEDMLFGFYALCKAKRVVYVNAPFYHRYHRLGSLSNRKGFYIEDLGRATCTDEMLDYVKQYKSEFLDRAIIKCFNYYMIILNILVYFRQEKKYAEVHDKVVLRLKELMHAMECPRKVLPRRLYICYTLYRTSRALYYIVVKVYYKYVKKEFDSKRQR